MTNEQIQNAGIILSVGNSVGANAKQLQAAIAAALVESGLRNLRYGDRDSQGLFQQRPSQGWGTIAQVTNPGYAARAFFLGAGTNKGALTVNQSGTVGQLAQRVQRSAFPDRYDTKVSQAAQLIAQINSKAPLDTVESPSVIPAETVTADAIELNEAGIVSGPMLLLAGAGIFLYWVLSD